MQAARCSQSLSLSTALRGSLRGKVRGAAGVLHAQSLQVTLVRIAVGGGLICGGLLTLHPEYISRYLNILDTYLHINTQVCQQVADKMLVSPSLNQANRIVTPCLNLVPHLLGLCLKLVPIVVTRPTCSS